jgi:hypothetical protein
MPNMRVATTEIAMQYKTIHATLLVTSVSAINAQFKREMALVWESLAYIKKVTHKKMTRFTSSL